MNTIRENVLPALFAAAAYGAYKACTTYDTYFSRSGSASTNLSRAGVYCTSQNGGIYTSMEDEFSNIPARATCFEVLESGLFGQVWETREDVPSSRREVVKEVEGWIFPGFWDGHGHVTQYGMMEVGVKAYDKTVEQIVDSILEYVERNPTHGTRTKWIQGTGWDQAYFGGNMPTAEDLVSHQLLADLYIALYRVDVHCIWVSPAVLRLLPSPLPPIPAGGSVPTDGVFCDNALNQFILPLIPPITEDDIEGFITTAVEGLQRTGMVGVMDAATAFKEVPVYRRLADGNLGMRIYGMVECPKQNTFCELDKEEIINEDGAFILEAVKLFADGALGSWGAALIDPYDDKPTTGLMLINETQLVNVVAQWFTARWQVNIHAIGDAANHAALNAFEAAMKLFPELNKDRRLRIEHAQIIHPDDQPRLEKLGIIPSIQPTHATSDMAYAAIRLGEKRIKESAYRMKTLFPTPEHPNKPKPIFGSDFPVEPASVIEGIYAAVTRCSPRSDKCERDKVWDEEKVTRLQAVRGFGRNVALGGWLEGYGVGRIMESGWADWVLLNHDLLDENVDLKEVEVRETWVGGARVWQKDNQGEAKDEI